MAQNISRYKIIPSHWVPISKITLGIILIAVGILSFFATTIFAYFFLERPNYYGRWGFVIMIIGLFMTSLVYVGGQIINDLLKSDI